MDTGTGAAGAASGLNTMNGGGQVPPENPTPMKTGKITKFYSRTFRHYVLTGNPDYTTLFNQQWSRIPYEHICCCLKPRDWQEINVISKRWRPLSVGFKVSHIIPFTNDKTTTGGAVGPSVTFNLLPYLETYIDKGYNLPITNSYVNLPNNNMSQCSGNQNTAQLRTIALTGPDNVVRTDTENSQMNNYFTKQKFGFDLMNSSEWGTANPGEEITFEHKFNAEDLMWRHAVMPEMYQGTGDNYQPANANGRWDGGIYADSEQNTLSATNKSIRNNGRNEMPVQPLPTALLRPVTIHNDKNELTQICFQILVTYHVWIEMDCNDIGNAPLFTTPYNAEPTWDQVINCFNTLSTSNKNFRQWTGGNAMGNFVTGPSAYMQLV